MVKREKAFFGLKEEGTLTSRKTVIDYLREQRGNRSMSRKGGGGPFFSV